TYRHVFISLVSYTTTIYTLSLHDALPIYIFTNLGTRPHSCPGIDHGAFIDVCTDIYIGRHKNNPFSKKCTIASQTVWNNPYTKLLIVGFKFHFIMKNKRPGFDDFHLTDWKI